MVGESIATRQPLLRLRRRVFRRRVNTWDHDKRRPAQKNEREQIMNKRNKGGQHFRKKVEKNKRERAIQNQKKLERLVREAAAEKLARSFGKKKGDS